MDKIKAAIEKFIKGGDQRDIQLLEQVLHPKYQNIQDGFFDQPGIFVIPREEYIRLVRDQVFGGHPRTITYHKLEQKNNIAYAEVSLESLVLKFSSLITCVQENGNWLVIGNVPVIEQK